MVGTFVGAFVGIRVGTTVGGFVGAFVGPGVDSLVGELGLEASLVPSTAFDEGDGVVLLSASVLMVGDSVGSAVGFGNGRQPARSIKA